MDPENQPDIRVIVQHSSGRCFSDAEYAMAGAELKEDMSECDILLGIKEVPVDMLIPHKTYLFFHIPKKLQPYNRKLLKAVIEKTSP